MLILNTRYWYLAEVLFFLAGISERFFSEIESIRYSSRSAGKIAIQVSFNSSDLQTSDVSFYAQANSVSCFILDGDLFVFKSAWPFLKKFRPFYILYSLYCWICLGYLSYCVLILTCGFRRTPQENRSFIETCLLKTWNVSPLEIFFISFTDNTTLL